MRSVYAINLCSLFVVYSFYSYRMMKINQTIKKERNKVKTIQKVIKYIMNDTTGRLTHLVI